jgi:flagellar hook-associated protein 3 FlgL
MRVTERMISQQSITSLQNNLERLAKLQEQVATGKRMNRPSDDPIGVSQVLRFDVVQNKIGQHLRNLDAVETSLKMSDAALGAASDILDAVKRVALSQSSGMATAEERAIASRQMQDHFDQLRQVANTTFNGRHLFSGYQTDTPPYDGSGVYQGDGGVTSVEAGTGVTIARNLPGQDAFGSALVGVDIFALLTDLKTAIDTNDQAGIQATLTPLGQAREQVTLAGAELGVRLQTVATNRDRLRNLSSNVAQIRSDREEANMAQVITEFQVQEAMLKAVQDSTARILQTSLLDFLR